MNKYQKLGFGVFVILVVAWMLQDRLTTLVIVAGVIALMTLATTWLVVFTGTEALGLVVKTIGKLIRNMGETVQTGSSNIKAHLRPLRADSVPSWDSLGMVSGHPDFDPAKVDISDFTSERSDDVADDLDVPQFLQEQWGFQPS